MFGRSLILLAALAVSVIASAASRSQSVTTPATDARQEIGSPSQPITPPPTLPDIPPLLPGRTPPGLPHYSGAAPSPGQFAPAPNPGPVTGYGPGGMAPVPGAPANPPYSSGPLR
jgi:hypothetical protein